MALSFPHLFKPQTSESPSTLRFLSHSAAHQSKGLSALPSKYILDQLIFHHIHFHSSSSYHYRFPDGINTPLTFSLLSLLLHLPSFSLDQAESTSEHINQITSSLRIVLPWHLITHRIKSTFKLRQTRQFIIWPLPFSATCHEPILLFLEQPKPALTSGILHWLLLLPPILFTPGLCLAHSLTQASTQTEPPQTCQCLSVFNSPCFILPSEQWTDVILHIHSLVYCAFPSIKFAGPQGIPSFCSVLYLQLLASRRQSINNY